MEVPAALAALALAVGVYRWGPRRRRPVYLLDFDMWRCDPKLKVTVDRFMQGSVACEVRALCLQGCAFMPLVFIAMRTRKAAAAYSAAV